MRCMVHSLQRMAAWRELDDCMSGESSYNGHVKRNTFDLWELRYAMAHNCAQLPSSAYNAWIAAAYCGAEDASTVGRW